MENNLSSLIARDSRHIWHPGATLQADDAPLIVERAQGSIIYTNEGAIIDAISSWWCKSLGHGHPAIIAAIKDQLGAFEHVIPTNTTYPAIVELAEFLYTITNKQHAYFASDGACAVEIAMKLALHAMQLQGYSHKKGFIALKNGYHGETLGTLGISDIGSFKKPYEAFSLDCHFIDNIPYVSGPDDPLWHDASAYWEAIVPTLEKIAAKTCAIIVEPLVQGANCMRIYSADFLKRLRVFAHDHGIYFIADEIMTGLGRTGAWLACDHAQIEPDMICLSKGLTGGALPLSCVMIDHHIYDLFYQHTDITNAFLHSHTHSGNALAVSVALATLKIVQQENLIANANRLNILMQQCFIDIADKTKCLHNIRGLGAIIAADLLHDNAQQIMPLITKEALRCGALIRPINNTIYWLPPLNCVTATILDLKEICIKAIEKYI